MSDLISVTALEETRLRVALGMLERVGLIRRHFDLPRLALLRLISGKQPPAEVAAFCNEWGINAAPREVDMLDLAAYLGVKLSHVEATVLQWTKSGVLHYDGVAREMLLELLPAPADSADRISTLLREYRAAQDRRVEGLGTYARSQHCRHRELAAHFGQRLQPCGDACDMCRSGRRPGTTPPLVYAEMQRLPLGAPVARPNGALPDHHRLIIEAVESSPAVWSSRDLAHLLTGSRGYSDHALTGALAGRSFDSIRAEIDVLVDAGHLAYQGKTLVAVKRAASAQDSTPAQAIVTAMTRLPFAVGRTGLARMLKGASSSPMSPDRSPDFGLLRHLTLETIEQQIESLVAAGLLERDTSRALPTLRLTSTGRKALNDPSRLPAATPATSRSLAPAPAGEPDSALMQRLRDWRTKRAEELGQPHFFVLSNAVLFDIALRQPMTLAELGAIKGIGNRKIEAWGEEILQLIGAS